MSVESLSGFFELKFSDLLQAGAEVGSASVIAWMIFKLQSRSATISGVKARAFDDYLAPLEKAKIMADEYISAPTPELKFEILKQLRIASNELNLILDIHTQDPIVNFNYTSVFGDYIAFKAAVTGGSFAAKNPNFTPIETQAISEKYLALRRRIVFIKLEIGS